MLLLCVKKALLMLVAGGMRATGPTHLQPLFGCPLNAAHCQTPSPLLPRLCTHRDNKADSEADKAFDVLTRELVFEAKAKPGERTLTGGGEFFWKLSCSIGQWWSRLACWHSCLRATAACLLRGGKLCT